MDAALYASVLEKKLVTQFKETFKDKMGYYPIVITNTDTRKKVLPSVSLDNLKKCFEPYLPDHHGVTLKLESKVRARAIVDIRSMYCHMAKSLGYTLNDIGYSLGGQDHTTVMHSLKTFSNMMETSESFRTKFQYINNRIKSILDINVYGTSDLGSLDKTWDQSEPVLLPAFEHAEDQTDQHNQC